MPTKTRETRRRQAQARRMLARVPLPNDGSPERMDVAFYAAKRVARFKELVEQPLFPEIYGRLLAGESVYKIVAWAKPKITDGPLAALSDYALARRLYRFRAMLPKEAFVGRLYIDEQFRRGHAPIDVMDELASAIRYQKARIDRFAQAEEAFPVPVEQQRRELLSLVEMLGRYTQAAIVFGLVPSPGPVIDARQVHVYASPMDGDDAVSTVERLLQARPSAIPTMLALFDELEPDADRGSTPESDVSGPPAAS